MLTKLLVALTLFTAMGVQAEPLAYKTQRNDIKINCKKEKYSKELQCQTFRVAYPQTGDTTLDTWALAKIKKAVGTTDLSNKNLKKILLKHKKIDTGDLGKDVSCFVEYIKTLELEGQTPQYGVFGLEDWMYICGAHGAGVHELMVLKRGEAKVKPVQLKDILLPNQMAKLVKLQKEGYVKFLMEQEMSEKEARAYVAEYNNKGFKGTTNWRFAQGGLVFLFQEYEIGSYATGRPAIYLSAQQLKGIIKPEILREAAKYDVNPKIAKEEAEMAN